MKKALLFIIALLLFIVNVSYAKYEYGNIMMRNKIKEIKKENQHVVIFPHWIHTMWYKCKTCHDDVFEMKRGANDITMENIKNGKQCGVCHNGKMAFNSDKCNKCHSLDSEEVELTLKTDDMTSRLYPSIFTKKLTNSEDGASKELNFVDPDKTGYEKYEEIANRLGAKWDPSALKSNGLFKDKFKILNFEKLVKHGVIEPLDSISSDTATQKEEKKENIVLFEVLSDFVDSVAFKHKEHTYWLKCSNCHEKIFVSKAGGNDVHMRRNSNGEFCGYCHGRVSFPLAECVRCHKYPKNEAEKMLGPNVIKRINPLKGKKLSVGRGGLIVEGTVAGGSRIKEKREELKVLGALTPLEKAEEKKLRKEAKRSVKKAKKKAPLTVKKKLAVPKSPIKKETILKEEVQATLIKEKVADKDIKTPYITSKPPEEIVKKAEIKKEIDTKIEVTDVKEKKEVVMEEVKPSIPFYKRFCLFFSWS